ncbi:MAG: [acyl-carrier-protein] S-malonyltransferase [Saprospiraceae bacterium]|jgi:[acyl-carrier-protein] S-malonyltransferase
MTAFVFPGQGAQFEGMGKDMFESSDLAKDLFSQADEILGYAISEVMFKGTMEELIATKITQPAIFIHSIIKSKISESGIIPDAVAGHSLGEFSALVAAGALTFADGLRLVHQRALAMQKACEAIEGTMAAILGLEDTIVEEICAAIDEVVVPANYNTNGQLVISGSILGINLAVEKLKEAGARRALVLQVGGAFHSPLMEPAREELQAAIEATNFSIPLCPVYQNVNAKPTTDPVLIKQQLIAQLTSPVRWTQTVQNMVADGIRDFKEVGGNGKVLKGLILKVDRSLQVEPL